MKTFLTLYKNEIKLSIRDMNMIIFAVALPLIVLVVLGLIYGTKLAEVGVPYTFLEQSMGAFCAISICAGGLMGLPIVIADIRERKILKRFKVTPVSPVMLLFVYLMLYVLYSAVSLITLLIAGALFWNVSIVGQCLPFLGSWLLTVVSTLSIGLMVGGIAKNSKTAGLIASILYFPMLIFSGTTLPFEVMPKAMQAVVQFFPLTQGIQLMKETFLGLGTLNALTPVIAMAAVTVVCLGVAIKFFKWE